jgi:hypothetical protein
MQRCPSCTTEVPEQSRFCSSCGTAQTGATPTQQPTQTSAGDSATPRSSDPSSISHDSFDHSRFLPGTLLSERYRIIGLLGKGGMGEVYRADDLKLGQPVALKFLPESLEQDPSRLSRLLNEVRLARQVSHPNVCRVYDVGELDGSHFMAMEYVDGEDLASLLRRIGRLPHEKALEISRQICAGLAAAHAQNILHRDLKPANVMIDGRGRVKLTDFGLAGLEEQVEGKDLRSGTPAYMAPEQLAGREVTVRSDIYSLGLVLYEIFTGKRAFSGKSVAEITRMQLESLPTSPGSLVSDMDDIVEQVILRCVEKEPRARPMSALAVSAALPGGDPLAAALAAGETPSPEMVAEAGASGGLRPAMAVGALIAVVLCVVLAVINAQRTALYPKLPFDTPPGTLATNAVQILDDLGIEELGPHQRWGFDVDERYLNWLDKNDPSPARAQQLASGRPPGARFWFRYSDDEMNPDDVHGFFVTADDPGQRFPGQGRTWLDLQGRLVGLEIVPAERLDEATATVEWPALFEAAGFDPADFVETKPVRAPTAPCDELRAWRGPVYGEVEGIVQAGRLAGAPVYFEIVGPWNLEDEVPNAYGSLEWVVGLFMVVIVISAMFLARRNLRVGRSDRKGAIKLMVFFVLSIMGVWFLTEVRLQTFAAGSLFEGIVFGRLLGHGLLHAMIAGLLYVALEPYVRRLWPETLVSWSRLLLGRVRDPLVGRDVLLGMAIVGALTMTVSWLGGQLARVLEIPPPLGTSFMVPSFAGIRYAVAWLLVQTQNAVVLSMVILVVLLLARLMLRRTWAAIGVVLLLSAGLSLIMSMATTMPIGFRIFASVTFTLIAGAMFICMLRFGLLSVIGGLFLLNTLQWVPLTWDLSKWYAGAGLVSVVAVLGVAGWAFYISLAGQKLFRDSVLGEH